MKFLFLTLGCKVNQFESQAMAHLLEQRGHRPAADGEAPAEGEAPADGERPDLLKDLLDDGVITQAEYDAITAAQTAAE